MKKLFFLIGGLLSSWAVFAQNPGSELQQQSLSYSDAAFLFSKEEINGTARYNALSGAFGALGGDFSAIEINPAGTAVFKNSAFGATLSFRKTKFNNHYVNFNVLNEDTYFNASQAGGVLVFDTMGHSKWSKFTLGFNYNIAKDFENNWLIDGTDQFTPLSDFYDPSTVYINTNNQTFTNTSNGQNRKFVVSMASQYEDNLYIGASLITHNIDFLQLAQTKEFNNDGNGNTFDVLASQRLATRGTGVSFGAGIIAKPIQELRLGIAAQTPTWYNLTEALDINRHETFVNNALNETILLNVTELDYKITTPARLTGSLAYVFGKEGFISFDYTLKDYKNIKLRPSTTFTGESQDLKNSLKNTSQFRVGAEIRLENISLRGGYHFEESPFKNPPVNSIKRTYGDIKGYSFGVGFKFGGTVKLDLAYQNSKNTDQFKFIDARVRNPNNQNQFIESQSADLNIINDKFTATLVFSL